MSRTNVVAAVALCLILGTAAGFAQGFFVTVNAGYGLGSGTQYLGRNSTYVDAGSRSYEGVSGSFGEGVKLGFSAGYMFTENLGVDLGFSYWLGNTIEINYYNAPDNREYLKWSGSGFVAVPSIVVATGMSPINPYARFGAVVGILKTKRENGDIGPNNRIESTVEETGNIAFGFAGAVGVTVPVGGAVDLYAEAVLHSVTYSPDQAELTKYSVNGADQLPSIQNKVTKYEDDWNSREDTPANNISQAVRRPFSSIGFAIGARVTL